MKVLYVEDNLSDIYLVKYHLKKSDKQDLSLDIAQTLKNAIEALGNSDYDLIILDLGLPDSLGLLTLKQMKEHSGDTPILVYSGDRHEHAKKACIDAGALDFVSKAGAGPEVLAKALDTFVQVFVES